MISCQNPSTESHFNQTLGGSLLIKSTSKHILATLGRVKSFVAASKVRGLPTKEPMANKDCLLKRKRGRFGNEIHTGAIGEVWAPSKRSHGKAIKIPDTTK